MRYFEEPLSKFLSDLASKTPTPGGGSSSALGGAIGTALGSMAAVYTSGNEKFKDVERQALQINEALELLRHNFVILVSKDIEAYGAYVAARALPKNTEDEKAVRKAALAEANENATDIPEKIMLTCIESLGLMEQLSGIVNPNLAGDVAAGAYFLEAAARGAGIQVLSNCATPGDAHSLRRRGASEKIAQCQAARQHIDAAVFKLLKIEC